MGQGLQNPNSVATYTQSAWGLNNSCMDPMDRATAMQDAANQQLAQNGVPPTSVSADPDAGPHDYGAFSSDGWKMQVNASKFSDDAVSDPAAAGSAANTIYHESRHTEQDFNAARYEAGLNGDAALAENGLPADVAQQAAANPYNSCSPDNANAEKWWSDDYGPTKDATEAAESGNDQAAYCNTNVEGDAWDTGEMVSDKYPGANPEPCMPNQAPAPAPAPAPESQVCGPEDNQSSSE